jgi:phospholipid transport system transporter-binding protein
MAQIAQTENIWHLSGDVVIGTASAILNASEQLVLAQNTTLDFSKVEDIDTTAISLILEWKRRALKQNVSLQVANLPVNLTNLINLYGVNDMV